MSLDTLFVLFCLSARAHGKTWPGKTALAVRSLDLAQAARTGRRLVNHGSPRESRRQDAERAPIARETGPASQQIGAPQ